MNKQEVAKILVMIAAVDDRIDPDQPRIQMWTQILNERMPFEFAREQVLQHYRTESSILMPATLNHAFNAYLKEQRLQAEKSLINPPTDMIPFPDEVKEMMKKVFKNKFPK